MSLISELAQSFESSGNVIEAEFSRSGISAGGQVTPPQLVEAVNQFLQVFDKLDTEYGENGLIQVDDVSQLGEHAMDCLTDLGVWAERLRLPQEKQTLDHVALGVAHWVIRHHGEIRILEPVVNALAANANSTESKEALKALCGVLSTVVAHTSEAIRKDLEKSDPTRPWRILNMNYAIVATRTQDPVWMERAFENLEQHLPEDCPSFFEEGLKQAEKPVYGPEVKELMAKYFARWNTRH